MAIDRPDSAACINELGRPRGRRKHAHPSRGLPLGRLTHALSLVALLALVGLLIHALLAGDRTLTIAAGWLVRARFSWVAAAIGCEVLSYLMYACAQRRLLGKSHRQLSTGWLASLAVCAQGVSNFLPAGYLAANVLNFRELCRRRVAGLEAGRLLVLSSALYIGSLACLTLLAGEVAGGRGGASVTDVRIGAAALLGILLLAAVGISVLVRADLLRLPRAWHVRLRRFRVSMPAASTSLALFVAAWLADAGCLVGAMRAVGASPAWSLVPIAYCAAQLMSFLPFTPGGLGLVEGSLTVALVAAGATSGRVLAAVLLYRLVSYWGTLPCGLVGYLVVRRRRKLGSTRVDADVEGVPAFDDRPASRDRSLLVLEG